MRVLFEVTDPKQVHIFKFVIRELETRGHVVAVTARSGDIIPGLLENLGIEFRVLSRRGRGLLGKACELLVRDWRLWRFARRFRPDILVSEVGPCAAQVGALLRLPVLVIEESEHSVVQQWMSFPFATRIGTPRHYGKRWGDKQRWYRSFSEIGYLHPDCFTPDPSVLHRAGLDPEEPYVVVRFLAFDSVHDLGQQGIPVTSRLPLLEELEALGRVVVSSEEPLSPEYARFRLPVEPHDFHHLLAFAGLYVGEGASVASEAALLGVPGIYVSTIRLGYLDRLEDDYGLAFSVSTVEEALAIARRLAGDPDTARHWQERRAAVLADCEDMTAWILREIESLGQSPSGPGGRGSPDR